MKPMKNARLLILICLSMVFTGMAHAQTTRKMAQAPQKMLRHVVLFKFKDGATPEQVKSLEEAFRGLRTKIKEVKGFEFGTNNSPENLNQGFTHCFVATFASEKDRETYLPHPAHKAFVEEYVKPYIDKVCVVDYWAR